MCISVSTQALDIKTDFLQGDQRTSQSRDFSDIVHIHLVTKTSTSSKKMTPMPRIHYTAKNGKVQLRRIDL